ncbi:MAG: hypothetical protein ACM3PE_09180 [Deltaproteobacteria bacterium]
MRKIAAAFILVVLVLAAGCAGSRQAQPEENLQSDFQKIMDRKASPREMIDFSNHNLSRLPRDSATRLVLRLESTQREQLEARTSALLDADTQIALQRFGYNSSLEDMIKSTNDQKLRSVLQETRANGFKLIPLEGNYYPIIDYERYQIYQPYINEDIKTYIDIAAAESNQAYLNDAALTITWPELARRALRAESFIGQYTNSARIDDVRQQYDIYVTTYLYGANNTPAFDYDTKTLSEKARQSYYEVARSSADKSQIVEVIRRYLPILEKNKYQRTPEVEQYLKNAQKSLLSAE